MYKVRGVWFGHESGPLDKSIDKWFIAGSLDELKEMLHEEIISKWDENISSGDLNIYTIDENGIEKYICSYNHEAKVKKMVKIYEVMKSEWS